MTQKVEHSLSARTISSVLLIALVIFLAWKLSAILILIVTAVMLAATLDPLVQWFHKRLSLPVSASMVLILLALPVVVILITVIPDFISKISDIIRLITKAFNSYKFIPQLFHNLDISQYSKEGGQYLLQSTTTFTNFIAELVILIFMTYYILIDSKRLHKFFSLAIPSKDRRRTEEAIKSLSNISGHYIRGNLLISLICAVIIFIGLFLLRVPDALPLAIFVGIMDLLPLIGATIGSIPALILAFTVSPLTGFLTIALFVLYQQAENSLIIPNVYNKALNLIPFLSFIAVIIGSSLFGIAGAFLSLPIAASIPTILHYFHDLSHEK